MPNTPTLSLPYPSPADPADGPAAFQALALALDGQQSFLPVGALILWPLSTAPPGANPNAKPAWLICNGQLVSVADYPKLAALLGSSGGNVTIPNLQDRVPIGASGGRPALSTGGEAAHAIAAAELPAHNHPVTGGVTNNAGFNANSAQIAPSAYALIWGRSPWAQRFIGTPGGATVNIINEYAATPGNDFGYGTGSHAHSLPAHGHGHTIGVANNAAPTQATPLIQPYLALSYAMRAA